MKSRIIKTALLSMLLLPVFASAQLLQQQDVIRLQAAGEVSINPDIAILKIAVTTEDENVAEAISENARKMNQVVQVIEKEIKDHSKIQTSRYQLNPINEYDQETKRSYITGYRVTNEVTVESNNLEGLGELIDDVVEVGSNQIQQLSFSHSDIDNLRDQALQAAITNGIEQANMMATTAGLEVTRVVEISTYAAQPGPTPVYREMAMMNDAKTTILPGEMMVVQQVYMTFAIN